MSAVTQMFSYVLAIWQSRYQTPRVSLSAKKSQKLMQLLGIGFANRKFIRLTFAYILHDMLCVGYMY